jgi:Glycosyltransferase Family 4
VRIAQIAPPWLAIPPDGYGGLEAVVAVVADGLVDRGHDVTLFAAGGSRTKARLETHYAEPLGTLRQVESPLLALPHLLHAYAAAGEFDVVHDHAFPIGPALGALLERPPVVHTVHTPPSAPHAAGIYDVAGMRLHLVAVSRSQRRSRPDLPFAATITNAD